MIFFSGKNLSEGGPPIVDRTEMTRWIFANKVFREEETNTWETAEAATNSMSRAVHSLVKKGLIAGYFKGWSRYQGLNKPIEFIKAGDLLSGDDRGEGLSKPRLQYLELTDKGHEFISKETNILKEMENSFPGKD